MVWRWPKTDILIASSKPGVGLESVSLRGSTMKEGSEGDAGSKDDPIPRDADSTVSNGSNGPLLSAVVASQTRRVPADSPRSQVMGAALAALGAEVASSAVATTTTIGNHGNLSLGRTTLANALLGITLDINRSNSPRDVIHGSSGNSSTLMASKINSTNKVGKGDSNGQSRDKVFVCRVCNRSFGYKHVLQNHERTHTGEKPFECKECHKRFTRDHHLKTHMRLHTGEKPYHCHHCDRQFVQVANLRRHLRVHTGERPYSCNLCSSRFSDSNQLKAHVLIHEGVKPFQCHKCLGRFRRRHHLVHHKCPKDAENIGKPRRGRRPKAYDEIPMIKLPASTKLPILSPVLQERLSAPITEISLPTQNATIATSVITKNPSSSPPPPQPPAAHMSALEKSRRSNHFNAIHYVAQRQNGLVYPENLQSGPLDMSLSSAPNNSVSVIVPRNSAIYKTASMDGVLDLSNSRSDSEAEPIEEEVDEADLEDDCLEDGLESESGEESMHLGLSISSGEWDEEDSLHTKMAHEISNHRGNGDRYESEGDGNTVAAKLKLASS